jgi:hypothetical protein
MDRTLDTISANQWVPPEISGEPTEKDSQLIIDNVGDIRKLSKSIRSRDIYLKTMTFDHQQ